MEELARRFLAALSAGDAEAVGGLVHPEIEVHTRRTTHHGRDAAVAWADKDFEHLERRYVPDAIEHGAGGALVRARLQYVWRESGRIGDESEVAIALGIRNGLISSWQLYEDPGEGRPP